MLTRNKTIDSYKAVLIILVVLRHVLECSTEDSGGLIGNMIWAIQMPGFMIISGFFAYRDIDGLSNLLTGIKKSIYRYLIPFLSWFIISVLIFNRFEGNIEKGFNTLINHVDNGLWFLWVLFILSITSNIFNYCINSQNRITLRIVTALISFSVLGLFLSLGYFKSVSFLGIKYCLYYSLYYYFGYIIKHYSLFQRLRNRIYMFEMMLFVSIIVFTKLTIEFDFIALPDNLVFSFVRFISALAGCFVLYCLVETLEKQLMRISLDRIGMYTLEIYSVHVFVCNLMREDSGYSFFTINGNLNFAISFILTCVLSYLIILILRRSNIANAIFFGKYS